MSAAHVMQNVLPLKRRFFSFQLSHGPQSLSRLSCLDADTLSVNTAGSLDVSFVGNMLCVERSNDPSKGMFFSDPGIPTAAEFGKLRADLAHSFQPVAVDSTNAHAAYNVGDFINAA
eukprot:43809_1